MFESRTQAKILFYTFQVIYSNKKAGRLRGTMAALFLLWSDFVSKSPIPVGRSPSWSLRIVSLRTDLYKQDSTAVQGTTLYYFYITHYPIIFQLTSVSTALCYFPLNP